MNLQTISPPGHKMSTTTFVFFILFCIVFFVGFINLEKLKTDPSAEKQSVEDAISITEGHSKYGIVEYSHYPNGPIYILTPIFALNPSLRNYHLSRVVPLFFSATAFALLFSHLIQTARTRSSYLWSVLAFMIILLQPGIINWFGALHKQAYEMALVAFILYAGLSFRNVTWIYLVTGFVAGWIGYDFCIMHLFCMFLTRLIFHSSPLESWLSYPLLKKVSLEALAGFSGIVAAIALHFVQNILYFGSVAKAWNDLAGAGMARMYMDNGMVINPEYLAWLKKASLEYQNPNPFTESKSIVGKTIKDFIVSHNLVNTRPFIMVFMFYAFVKTYSIFTSLVLMFLMAIGLLVYRIKLLRGKHLMQDNGYTKNLIINLFIFAVVGFTGAILWFIVMKYHAMYHYHFLPRLFFAPTLLLIVYFHSVLEKLDDISNCCFHESSK